MKKLPHMSDEHHYALANLVTFSAQLEHQVEYAIVAAMGEDRKKTALFLLKSFNPQKTVELLQLLLLELYPATEAKTREFMKRIFDLRDQRNTIIHSLSGPSDDPQKIFITSMHPHKYKDDKGQQLTAKDIQTVADQMAHAYLELNTLSKRLRHDNWVKSRDPNEAVTYLEEHEPSIAKSDEMFGTPGLHMPDEN